MIGPSKGGARDRKMSAQPTTDLTLEIAHLLLIDVVGYSKLLVNEQIELLQELNRVVRSTVCFQAAEKNGKLIRLPTGDGMALLFFRSPEEPVRCALEVSDSLKKHPKIQVRMGIHSGPINQVQDVNDRSNVAGAGINVAQRVLDCGDAGHILMSKRLADDLAHYRHWQPYLHDLGECEVKHGMRLSIVNLHKDGLGNPALPEKLKPGKGWKWNPRRTVRPVSAPRWPKVALIAALLLSAVALTGSLLILFRHPAPPSAGTLSGFGPVGAIPEKSIAVLPFDNLSDDKQNAYFADGVQDEILNDLAKVADLKVISRTSVMQFKNSAQRNLREIANALGVTHILEGTVKRAGDQIRVNAQLIDARTDAHIWGERYDRNLADVFAVENDVAEQIVAQLKSQLSPKEKAAIEQRPTNDLAAYDLYVRAKVLIDKAVFNEPRKNLFEAVRLLEQAVQRDPSFMLAYYQLAHAHDQVYLFAFDHTKARLAAADAAVQSVRRLRPDSGEAHLALAKHLYWGYLAYDRARQELEDARRALPNDSTSYLLSGYIDRRQGRWEESIRNMQHAAELDPQNFFILQQLSLTYNNLRRYADTAAILDRALKLAPRDASLRVQRAYVDLDWRADLTPLHSVTEAILGEDPHSVAVGDRLLVALYERDMNTASQALAALSPDALFGKETVSLPRPWWEGLVARLRGDASAARVAFTRAREEVDKIVREQPDNGSALCGLGMIDAALGNKKDAIREGERAVELVPVTKDTIDGAMFVQYLAVIYAWAGKKDAAFERLSVATKIPGYLSYGQLMVDPMWEPLRSDPRFEKIVGALAPK
jgi:TolB-like protein/class 3 adenylate cyclase/Tfp pilus assembly protein PilF